MISTTSIDSAAADALFFAARSTHPFTDDPVGEDDLRAIWEYARVPPTASNTNPLRVVFARSDEARARLVAHMAEGNRAKTAAAPAVALLAADTAFHERMPDLFPARPELRETFGAHPRRAELARFNATLQAGYFLLAVRAAGFAAGPMTGFDHAGMDAEFFADGRLVSLMVVNIGRPAGPAPFDRLPRLPFEDAVQVL